MNIRFAIIVGIMSCLASSPQLLVSVPAHACSAGLSRPHPPSVLSIGSGQSVLMALVKMPSLVLVLATLWTQSLPGINLITLPISHFIAGRLSSSMRTS